MNYVHQTLTDVRVIFFLIGFISKV